VAKTYTVARTVVYYFEVEAESEQQALTEVGQMEIEAACDDEQITQQVIYVEEMV
jgi:mannitol/fructose-specific phosphotransferase system IIA component (Ntr-type)